MNNTYRKLAERRKIFLFGSAHQIFGSSSKHGFQINVLDNSAPDGKKFFPTTDHKVVKKKNRFLPIALTLALYYAVSVPLNPLLLDHFKITFGQWMAVTVVVFLAVRTAIAFGYIIPVLATNKTFRRWHGAEHRLIYLLVSGEELTSESFWRTPNEHPKCCCWGRAKTLAVFLTLSPLLLLTPFALSTWEIALPVILIGALLSVIAAEKAVPPLSYAIQRYLTTATPTDAQIAEAIRIGEQIKQQYRNADTIPASAT